MIFGLIRRIASARRRTASRRKSSVLLLPAHAPVHERIRIPLSTSSHNPDRTPSKDLISPKTATPADAVCGAVVRLFIIFSVLVVFAVMAPVSASAG
jgi:hypothetical protein